MLVAVTQTMLVGGLVAVIVYVVSTALRNHRAHNFFKIHSPNLPAAPNLGWFGGNALDFLYGGRNWYKAHKLHLKLGANFSGFLRDRPFISTTDLNLIKRMVIDEPNEHPNRPKATIICKEIEVDSFPFSEDDQWRRIRKAFTPAFSTHKVKSANVQAEIKSVINKFVASIDRRLDKQTEGEDRAIEIDADDLFHRYSLALVFACFYKQKNLIDFDSERDQTVHSVDITLRRLNNPLVRLCIVFPILVPIALWLTNNFHPQARLRSNIIQYIKQQTELHQNARQTIDVARRTGESVDEDDLVLSDGQKFQRNMIDHVIDQFRMRKLSSSEYIHSSVFLFFAANKTSADALTKTFYLLASHQDIQNKLRKVIMSAGTETDYVNWVLLEAMRLYPPALIGCTRVITKDFHTKDGHLIPKGTTVHTPAYTIHRLKEFWGEDADEFRPERWANSKDFHPCQYLAFGAGKRGCPGKDFAMNEMRMLLGELLLKYKFDSSERSEGFQMFAAPMLIFMVSDKPTYIKISHLEAQSASRRESEQMDRHNHQSVITQL